MYSQARTERSGRTAFGVGRRGDHLPPAAHWRKRNITRGRKLNASAMHTAHNTRYAPAVDTWQKQRQSSHATLPIRGADQDYLPMTYKMLSLALDPSQRLRMHWQQACRAFSQHVEAELVRCSDGFGLQSFSPIEEEGPEQYWL